MYILTKLAYDTLHKFMFQHPELGKKMMKALFFSSKTGLNYNILQTTNIASLHFSKVKERKIHYFEVLSL